MRQNYCLAGHRRRTVCRVQVEAALSHPRGIPPAAATKLEHPCTRCEPVEKAVEMFGEKKVISALVGEGETAEQVADSVLAKVKQSGLSSLTAAERRFLERTSQDRAGRRGS